MVRELGDHGDVVPAGGEVLGERLHARLGRADLGREVLRNDQDPQPARARRNRRANDGGRAGSSGAGHRAAAAGGGRLEQRAVEASMSETSRGIE